MSERENKDKHRVPSSEFEHGTFAERINMLTKQHGGAAALARKSGVSDSVVRKWQHGRSEPSLSNLVAIANASGVSVEWLATGEIGESGYQVGDNRGGYLAEKSPEVDLGTAETIMESMVREGLIKKDRRTPIRQFISIYNDLGKEKPSREEIDQVVLEHLLDYLYQQLEGFAALAAMGQPDKELNAFEDQLKEMIKKVEARLER